MVVSIHLFGLPTDCNSSFERGVAGAPVAIRAALFSPRGNMATQIGGEIGTQISLIDQGDLPLSEDTPADDLLIAQHVMATLDEGAVPLALGGDHAVSLPLIEAVARRHGPVSVLHIDAHPDCYDDFEGNPRSHASPFARLAERGCLSRLMQVGIRTMNDQCAAQVQRFGFEVVPMLPFRPEAVPVLTGPLYISIDLDGIDPSEAPGVNHPEPGGLTVRELLALLHRQTAPIVGVDIVELNPQRDVNGVTAILAAKLVRECAALIHRNTPSPPESAS